MRCSGRFYDVMLYLNTYPAFFVLFNCVVFILTKIKVLGDSKELRFSYSAQDSS